MSREAEAADAIRTLLEASRQKLKRLEMRRAAADSSFDRTMIERQAETERSRVQALKEALAIVTGKPIPKKGR